MMSEKRAKLSCNWRRGTAIYQEFQDKTFSQIGNKVASFHSISKVGQSFSSAAANEHKLKGLSRILRKENLHNQG